MVFVFCNVNWKASTERAEVKIIKRFKTNKLLWGLTSLIVFLLCWLYPMHFGKEGTYPLGRLWFDLFGGSEHGTWVIVAILSGIFGIFAALFGFAVQALVVLVQGRIRSQATTR
jgi:hypothetical protein